MYSDKKKKRIKRTMEYKDRAAEILGNDRLFNCSKPFSIKCLDCKAFSIKDYLQIHNCGLRYCPFCASTSTKSEIYANAIFHAIVAYSKKNQLLLPIHMVFTMPHCENDKLNNLLKTLKEAWRLTRKHKEAIFWKKYIEGEIFATEILYEPGKKSFHPHIHCIALKREGNYENTITNESDNDIPFGCCRITGVEVCMGLRTLWGQVLRKAWGKFMERPWPLGEFCYKDGKPCDEAKKVDISKAKVKIDSLSKKSIQKIFPELCNNKSLRELQFEAWDIFEKQHVPKLIGKPKLPIIHISHLFRKEYSENGKVIRRTSLKNILKQRDMMIALQMTSTE